MSTLTSETMWRRRLQLQVANRNYHRLRPKGPVGGANNTKRRAPSSSTLKALSPLGVSLVFKQDQTLFLRLKKRLCLNDSVREAAAENNKTLASFEYKNFQTILYLLTEIKTFSLITGPIVYVFSVTHICPACVCHRPHGLSLACTQRCGCRRSANQHIDKDH